MANLTAQHRKVLPGEEIDDTILRKVLLKAKLLSNQNAQINLQQFSSGYSNLTYLIETEGCEFVLRRPPVGAVKRGHDMGREYKVLKALNGNFTKVPEVYFFDESEILGVPFYVMEKVDGIILNTKEAYKRKVNAIEYQQISKSWLETFVELHAIDYKGIGLGNFGKPEGYNNRQVTNWSKQYHKAKTKEVPAADTVMAWMAENLVQSDTHCLIHNDFRYDNVIFQNEAWENVSAVLDWEMTTIGDPMMDLGTTLAYWTMNSDPDFVKQGLPSPTIMEGNPGRAELASRYETLSGRKVDNLVFYYVYGLFKIAVIAQQIYYRYDKGLTADPKFAGLEQASEGLCTMALQAIQKGRIEDLF